MPDLGGTEPVPIDIGTVTCSGCGTEIGEDEAQAQRWGYWPDGARELFPFCAECARHEFSNWQSGGD
jgi:hypothetical protein